MSPRLDHLSAAELRRLLDLALRLLPPQGRRAVLAEVEGTGKGALYEALRDAGRIDEAFALALEHPAEIAPARVWDDAVALGRLDELRARARAVGTPVARWIGGEEAELCALPEQRYDHEGVKAVVAYAVARLTHGERVSTAESDVLPGELASRLGAAPGDHDRRRCADAAVEGLERLIAFHVAGRSRARYARAARYWAEHADLAPPARRAALGARFADEIRRLPGLRDELARAGVQPLLPGATES